MVAVGLLPLSGCVTSPKDARAAPRGAEGGVVLNVGNNMPGFQAMYWLAVRRVADAVNGDETCYSLRVSKRGETTTVALAGALPAGTYEFPTIGIDDFPAGACNRLVAGAPKASAFGRFRVEAGKLTDLGVLEKTRGSSLRMAYVVPMQPAARTALDERLRVQFPELAKLPLSASGGWIESSLPSGWRDMENYALDRSFGMVSPSEGTDGSLLFGTRTGMVRAWVPGETHARLLDTGHRVSLLATAMLADGAWVVGGEESTLLRSDDHGKTWQSVRGNLPFGIVEHAATFGTDVVLTLLDEKHVSVYRGRADGSAWKKVASFETSFSFWNGLPGQTPQTAVVGDDYDVSLPSTHLGVYHVSSGRSEVLGMPGSVTELGGGRDGVLRCRCLKILVVAPYESLDLGKSWHGTSAGRFYSLPAMRDAAHGVMISRDTAMDPPSFTYTEDGQHWQVASPAPLGADTLFYARDGRTAYATEGGTMLMATRDDGKHWVQVWSSGATR
jgi:photosystem II stability/assembly factor-like uncharacterized protein